MREYFKIFIICAALACAGSVHAVEHRVCVGSFQDRKLADERAHAFDEAGIKVVREEVKIRNEIHHRVIMAGVTDDLVKAQRVLVWMRQNPVTQDQKISDLWIRSGPLSNQAPTEKSEPLQIPMMQPSRAAEINAFLPEIPVSKPEEPVNITSRGEAGVTQITDTSDKIPPQVVQAIPGPDKPLQANTPIVIFMDDKVFLPSLPERVTVTADDKVVKGNLSVVPSAQGYAVLNFTPEKPYPPNSKVVFTIKRDTQDKGGNKMAQDFVLTLRAASEKEQAANTEDFSSNLRFEKGMTGISVQGDGAVLDSTDVMIAPEGKKFLTITNGNTLVSKGEAVEGATGIALCGPLSKKGKLLSFTYNFISSEFNESNGGDFDDTAMVIISGPVGQKTFIISSVNLIGRTNKKIPSGKFASMPDHGDDYAGMSGWKKFTVPLADVGSPYYITFIVTDVKDTVYSSVLLIDDLQLQ